MAVRRGPIDLGDEDARAIVAGIGKEIRAARIALGLSQGALARAAGLSPSQVSRVELGSNADPGVHAVCRVGRALGLSLSARLYPAGSPVRDAGQQRVLERFLVMAMPPLASQREVGLPIPGDLRAWDATLSDLVELALVDAESRLGDMQALERRLQLKLRDDHRSKVLVLAVGRSRHNLEVLDREREVLRGLLPLDGPAIARSVRAGRVPPGSGLIVV